MNLSHAQKINDLGAIYYYGLEVTNQGDVFGVSPRTMEYRLLLTKQEAEELKVVSFDTAVEWMRQTRPAMQHTIFTNMGA